MGRLIDADKLKTDLEKAISKNEDMDCLDFLRVASVIDAQPTAYDQKKVVEQLEKRSKEYNSGVRLHEKPEEMLTDEAIEIVKGEYVTEQSCEWKLEDSESNLYVTECENRQLIFEGTPEENGYKYCPYCGRKIKRGGADGN